MQTNVTAQRQQFSIHQVFYLSELAEILRMPVSLVQNWTMGRPLTITPHRSATGSGSRNLYDVQDLYRFGIAKHLSMGGIAPHAIQSIIDALGVDFESAAFAIATSDSGGSTPWNRRVKPRLQLVSQAQYERYGWGAVEGPVSKLVGCYVLSIVQITESINHLVSMFLQGRSAKPSSKPVVPPPSRTAKSTKKTPGIFGSGGRKFRHDAG
jgi:DNA-binding transcriptional MerR regulator